MTHTEGNLALSAMLIVIAILSFRQFLVIRRDPQRDWLFRNSPTPYRLWAANRENWWVLRFKFGYLWGTFICTVGALALIATA